MSWLIGGDADLPDTGWVVAIGLLGAAVVLWRGQSSAETRSAPPVVEAQTDAATEARRSLNGKRWRRTIRSSHVPRDRHSVC